VGQLTVFSQLTHRYAAAIEIHLFSVRQIFGGLGKDGEMKNSILFSHVSGIKRSSRGPPVSRSFLSPSFLHHLFLFSPPRPLGLFIGKDKDLSYNAFRVQAVGFCFSFSIAAHCLLVRLTAVKGLLPYAYII
jgi:hypothetical protein